MAEPFNDAIQRFNQSHEYGWKITKLCPEGGFWTASDEARLVGTGVNVETEFLLTTPVENFDSEGNLESISDRTFGSVNRREWRVLDDDKIPYAEGIMWGDHYELEPLDEWATADLGATIIQTRAVGSTIWEAVN